MKNLLKVALAVILLGVIAGCGANDTPTNTQGAALQSDVAVVKFTNDAKRDGVALEIITEGSRRLLVANDATVLIQRLDYSGFSDGALWQLGAGMTIKYEYLLGEIAYVAPDYPEYVVHKLFIYANGYPDMPVATENNN